MSTTDFVLIAYSIVLGVGLATLLSNLAWLIRDRSRVTFSWIHGGWVLLTFLWLCAAWWDTYVFSSKTIWAWADFILAILVCTSIVLQAQLVIPSPGDVGTEKEVDLERFWVDHRTAFLGMACCHWGLALVWNLSNPELSPDVPLFGFLIQALVQFSLLGVAIWRSERIVHASVLAVFVILHLAVRLFSPSGVI